MSIRNILAVSLITASLMLSTGCGRSLNVNYVFGDNANASHDSFCPDDLVPASPINNAECVKDQDRIVVREFYKQPHPGGYGTFVVEFDTIKTWSQDNGTPEYEIVVAEQKGDQLKLHRPITELTQVPNLTTTQKPQIIRGKYDLNADGTPVYDQITLILTDMRSHNRAVTLLDENRVVSESDFGVQQIYGNMSGKSTSLRSP